MSAETGGCLAHEADAGYQRFRFRGWHVARLLGEKGHKVRAWFGRPAGRSWMQSR